jgi:uncharacterized lipoprotein YajG
VRPLATLLSVLALATLAGCAITRGLDVTYPEAGVNRALLARVPARQVGVSPVVDHRTVVARIGSRKDGAGIVTSRPVGDIIREALAAEVTRNGHAVRADAKDVVLAAEVEEFWLDVTTGYSSTQYVGTVVLALAVVDGHNGETLFSRRYAGIKRREVEREADDVARDVMDVALARTLHDFATDPEMAAAFGRRWY